MCAIKVGELFSELRVDSKSADQSLAQHQRALQNTEQQAGLTEGAIKVLNQTIIDSGGRARNAMGHFVSMGSGIQSAGQQSAAAGGLLSRLNQYITTSVSNAARLGTSMRGTGQSAGEMSRGVDAGSRSLRDMSSVSGQAVSALDRVGGMMRQVVATAAGFVVAQVGMKVLSAAADFVKDSFIGMNSMLEQSKIAFTTMLGGAEIAGRFLKDLGRFAAETPFDFPGLLVAAQRMRAYQFATEDILPLLEDVGNVAAGLGAGAQGVDRITLALGQMNAKGKVQTQELLQLTELGIPAFQMLADAIGISVGEVQDLVSAGEISADTFLRIFQDWSRANFGDMMAQQSKTGAGAVSNITDVLQMAVARGLEPFYGALRDGAVRFAEFLETDRFERWVTTITALSRTVVDGILAIPETASSIRVWVSDIVNSGAPLEMFLNGLPGWFQDAVSRIGDTLGIGGYNTVTAFAQGMIDSASTNVQAAIDYIAGLIASYLVGQSPPPNGPLSAIDAAGRNLMETYTDGMVQGAAGAERAGESVLVAMRRLDEAAQLDAGRAGLDAAAGSLEAMEFVAESVTGKIASINREMAAIDLELREIDREIQAINNAYDATLEPLEEQLKLLERQRDLQAEKLQLEHDLARAKVQQAQLEALGDPERRAEIAGEMALLDIEKQRAENAKRIAEIEGQLDGSGNAMSDDERKRLELKQQGLILDRQETQHRLATDRDLSGTERQRLQLRLEQIDLDIAGNQARLRGEVELTEAERARLELQLRELELRQELLNMIDAESSAQATADAALLDSRQKEKDLIEEIADLQNEIAKIPILEEIEKVNESRRKALEPLEAEREILVDQKEDLDHIRAQWQFIKGDVDSALEPMREAARLAEQNAKAAERAADAAEREAEAARKKLEAAQRDNSFEASQARLAGTGTACPVGWEMDEFGRCFNPAEVAWRESIAEHDRKAKKKDDPALQALRDFEDQQPRDVVVPTATPDGGDNLHVGMLPPDQARGIGAGIGTEIVDGMLGRVGSLLKDNLGRIIGSALGGLAGSVIGPKGAIIGSLLGGQIGARLQEALEGREIDGNAIVSGLRERAQPIIAGFTTFITDYLIPVLIRVKDDILPAFVEAWARIEPAIGPALENIGRLIAWVREQFDRDWQPLLDIVEPIWNGIARVVTDAIGQASRVIAIVLSLIGGDWQRAWGNAKEYLLTTWNLIRDVVRLGIVAIQKFITDAVPVIWAKLKEWGSAFVDWLGPQIPVVLAALGRLLVQVGSWIINDGLPALVLKIKEWGSAFLGWIESEVAPNILPGLESIGRRIVTFIEEVIPEFVSNLKGWAGSFLGWIGDEVIPFITDELWSLLSTIGGWIIETALPAIIEKLGEWADAFLNWMADEVVPYIVEKAGAITTTLFAWMKDTALPGIRDQLIEWAGAFLSFVKDEVIPYLAGKLTELSTALLGWIKDTALPEIKTALLTWAGAFLNFVKDEVIPYLREKLGDLLTLLKDWVTDSLSDVKDSVKSIGESIVEGIWEGIKGLGGWFKDRIGGWIEEHVPDFIYDRLDGGSPARKLFPIGESIVQGLVVGIDNEQTRLQEKLREMAGMITGDLSVSVPRMSSAMSLPAASGGGGSLAGVLGDLVKSQQSATGQPGALNLNLRLMVGRHEFRDILIEELNSYTDGVY